MEYSDHSFIPFKIRNYVLEKSDTLSELGGLNWKMVIALGLAWLFTILVLIRGVEVMGKVHISESLKGTFTIHYYRTPFAYILQIAWMTGTTPYIIIIILFIRCHYHHKCHCHFLLFSAVCRGVTLDGAKIGLDYYLLKPNMTVIWQAEV